jgi:ATPase involved in DNA repair/ATPase family associated with various cellular activities (AAA)
MTDALNAGTYEVLRNRLREAAVDLRTRLKSLDVDRAEVFGNIPTTLLTTQRVTTEHNCVPRDVIAIGEHLLLGYNVQFGLKTEIGLADVFGVYKFDGTNFHEVSLDLISDPRFVNDFHELYRFYKGTRLARFFVDGPSLHLVFQVGKTTRDIKSFKFRMVDGSLTYIDNRSEHEVRDPAQHEFRWNRTTRDQHHYGTHPHISIEDRVYVETVGGDLTIKIENNTATGEGIYAEPVSNPDQTLDDAEIHYAIVGNLVLLKVRPYQETQTRYLVFNGKVGQAMRLDEIEHSCVMLPGDHGIIFPGGYYLQTGQFKRFDHGLSGMRFQRTIASPNGEDFLYLFYNAESGTYVQLRYNLIRQTVDVPLVVHGQTLFADGEMVCFKAQDEASKHHALQVWQTPFTSENRLPESKPDSLLFKIGNRDLVRGMAECGELILLIDKDDSYEGLYVDLVKKASGILDSYFWIDKEEAKLLHEPIAKIRDAASSAVEEFEKVVRVRRQTESRSSEVRTAIEELAKSIERGRFESIDHYVDSLAQLRTQRGHALGLKELRYVDESLVASLEQTTAQWTERLSQRAVEFLLTPGSLKPYEDRVAAAEKQIEKVTTVVEAKTLEKEIDAASGQLEMLTETVSNLRIEDATKRTEIIDSLSAVFASLNRVRAGLKNRITDLIGVEGQAEFASQLKLLEQTVAGYLDVCDTPNTCDSYLTKVMVQIEELEGRFAEFDDFVLKLAERREEVYAAFESRKVSLVEKRNRRAESLSSAAGRILKGIETRVGTMQSTDEIAAYFAGDLMVEKVRDIVKQLGELGDAVRVEDLQSRLKTIREDSTRQLKDRQDLFEDGGDLIRLGKRKFAVNRQPLDLTTVLRDGALCLHLTGTQFFEPLDDPALMAAKDLWAQPLATENADVYRSEFLAVEHFGLGHRASDHDLTAGRFEGGYAKGVHDVDAAKILDALWKLHDSIGLLRHTPTVRAAAEFWSSRLAQADSLSTLKTWVAGFASLAAAYPKARPAMDFRQRLADEIEKHAELLNELFGAETSPSLMADYLFDAWIANPKQPIVSGRASDLYQLFVGSIAATDRNRWMAALADKSLGPFAGFVLARNWADAFLSSHSSSITNEIESLDPAIRYRNELAWLIMVHGPGSMKIASVPVALRIEGLAGNHGRIQSGAFTVHFHELLDRVAAYVQDIVPRYRALHETKTRIVDAARKDMRLDEFKPRVLTSFVRNRLLDEVYLPLIGDNLAKQIGTSGEDKRTDRMGLLLLISPPGYGKTTLMEYIANRLGIVFMKINGPAIGHGVTSLDPAEAPNAAAREEVQRLNLALEMGDNVMLYLDDIQHTHPELLQKFISLCDATRKIEGVRNGKTRTYDLRGRRVAVVMSGNPYTESGERFQVPDMLSNRADVYNLGEVVGGAAEAFEMSYLENCLTSNAVLAPLSTASPEDSRAIIQAAMRDSMEGMELQSNIASDDVREMFEVMRKLIRVRDIVLRVNRAYIQSAAQADAYRTEPPFKLQGSYRNMNRIAERVASVMNDQELTALIIGSYEQEAQTLTTDNEANILKFKELMGILTPIEKERWESIKYAYLESTRMAGMSNEDAAGQLMRQLQAMRDGLESIRAVISRAVATRDDGSEQRMDARIESLRQSLAATGHELSQTLSQTGKQLETISTQQALAVPEQKILVQHKIPRVLADLVQGQFHLMQEWMRPLLSESLDNGRDLERLKNQLESLLRDYKAVEKSFNDDPEDTQEGGPV